MPIRRAAGTSSFAEDLDALIKYWRSRDTTIVEIETALADAVVPEAKPKRQPPVDEQNG